MPSKLELETAFKAGENGRIFGNYDDPALAHAYALGVAARRRRKEEKEAESRESMREIERKVRERRQKESEDIRARQERNVQENEAEMRAIRAAQDEMMARMSEADRERYRSQRAQEDRAESERRSENEAARKAKRNRDADLYWSAARHRKAAEQRGKVIFLLLLIGVPLALMGGLVYWDDTTGRFAPMSLKIMMTGLGLIVLATLIGIISNRK